MKKPFLFVLSIIFLLISGCADSDDKKSLTESQITPIAQEQVAVETEKKPEPSPEPSVETREPQKLDLSLPVKKQEVNTSDNSLSNEKSEYLPDLFAGKKKKTKLQVDGTLIEKEEEEAGKDRIVDGVGINFKLTK
jgi:hypothetical protein